MKQTRRHSPLNTQNSVFGSRVTAMLLGAAIAALPGTVLAASAAPTDSTAAATMATATTTVSVAITAPAVTEVTLPVVGSAASVDSVKAEYNSEQWQKILDGEIVLKAVIQAKKEGQKAREGDILLSAIVDHPPVELWKIMTDYAKYGEFLPKVEEMKVLGRTGTTSVVYHQLGIMWVDIAYTLLMTEDRAHGRISWVLDERAKNDILATTGYYEMIPFGDGSKTLMSYRTWVKTGMAVPAFIENFLTKRAAPKILRNIRERADELFGVKKQ